jgi:hypothetical protein
LFLGLSLVALLQFVQFSASLRVLLIYKDTRLGVC